MIKLSGKKLYDTFTDSITNQLKILYPRSNKNYILLYNGKPYNLEKKDKFLVWNIPKTIPKSSLPIKIQALDSDTGSTSYVTNEVIIQRDLSEGISEIPDNDNNSEYDLDYPFNSMIDEHKSIPIVDKKINVAANYQIVSNDNISQLITFEMNRFYDGVDLSKKACNIKYINAKKNEGRAIPINFKKTSSKMIFCWLLDTNVTECHGSVKFAIEFLGYENDELVYLWQTLPAEIRIENGLWVGDGTIVERYPSLIEDILLKLKAIEAKIGSIDDSEASNGTWIDIDSP